MLFCSQKFLVFFLIVFAIYWAIPRQRLRVWLLLGASFYFYATWNAWLALFIGVSTVMDYGIARGLDYYTHARTRRILLLLSLIANLGLLCYFKYSNFFLEQLYHSFRIPFGTNDLLKVFIPIGISFYTFEAINYTIDVYRKKVVGRKERGELHAVHHVLSAPGCRPDRASPRFLAANPPDASTGIGPRIQLGVQFFLMGLFKKLAIADRMSLFSDPVFARPTDYNTNAVWLAVLAYAIQIYCDFSGYTDMALGIAHMFGYKLAKNFDMPYISQERLRVLAPLAHFAVELAARLSVHPAWRQPRHQVSD